MALSKIQGAQIQTPVDISTVNITGVGTITNGSITNLTGTAGTVTTLRSTTLNADTGNIVTGVTTNFTSTNVVISGVTTVSAGTSATPSISPSGDSNTGIFFPAADHLNFSTGGTSRVQIESDGDINIDGGGVFYDATNNRFGVGTMSPKSILTTQGNIVGLSETTHSLQHYQQAAASYTVTSIDSVISGASGSLVFKTGTNWTNGDAVEQARIDSSGRLLIGTSTVTSYYGAFAKNYVTDQGGTTLPLVLETFRNDDAGAYLVLSHSRSTTAGNYTILQSNDGLGLISFNGSDGVDLDNVGASISAFVDGTPGANDMPGRLVFSTTADGASSPTERMRIDKGGSHALYGIDQTLVLSTNQASSASLVLFYGRYGATAVNGGTDCIYIRSNGNIQNTNNSYGAISDAKLKENIVDANSQWSDIKALQVRKFNFKEGQTHTQIGLVAQEVELVSPGIVSEAPDRDAEGNDLGTVTKSVNYSVLYMKAVKALQEAMERIEQLETSNADLLSRMIALEVN